MLALHYRWNVPGNAAWAQEEFGRCGFPWLPRVLATRLCAPICRQMQSYRSIVGVSPSTESGIERFAEELIRALDDHFSLHTFLLGDQPCRGDFALCGPLWAHLYRDPHSRHLFDDAPHCRRWLDALNTDKTPRAETTRHGTFLTGDVVPVSLDPIFRTLFDEQWPLLLAVTEAVDAYFAENPSAKRIPRVLGSVPITIGGSCGERKLITFMHWKAQRVFDAYGVLSATERISTDTWLTRVGGLSAMRRAPRTRLERVAGGKQEELRPVRTDATTVFPLSRL